MAEKIEVKVNKKIFESQHEACRFYNIPVNVVRGRIKRGWSTDKAYSTPKFSKEAGVNHPLKYELNHSFFEKIDKPEKAYFLGLIATDGYISRTGYVSRLTSKKDKRINLVGINLSETDKHILYSFQNYLKTRIKITINKNSKYIDKKNQKIYFSKPIYRFLIRSEKLANDLLSKGIILKKSLKLKFPSHGIIPENLFHHYIRGLFDGDGSLSKNKDNRYQISITGGSKTFLNSLLFYLQSKEITSTNNKVKKKLNIEVFRIVISNKQEILNFLKYIYFKSNEKIRLKRKYNMYHDFIKIIKSS